MTATTARPPRWTTDTPAPGCYWYRDRGGPPRWCRVEVWPDGRRVARFLDADYPAAALRGQWARP